MAAHASSDAELALPPELAGPPSPRKRLLRILAVVGLALVALGAAIVLAPKHVAPAYRTAPVLRRTVIRVAEATGRLDVTSRVEVPAPSTGKLANIRVKSGDAVQAGQPLGALDDVVARASLESARVALRVARSHADQARAERASAKDALERTLSLSRRGLASDGDLAAARAADRKADAALRAARADVEGASRNVDAAEVVERSQTLRAPVAGLVMRAPEWPGQVVAPEHGPLFVIGADASTLRLQAQVTEADIGLVRPGQIADFSVPAFPERTFTAEVERRAVEPERTDGAPSYAVLLRAPNPDHVLLPGMTTTVRIHLAQANDVLVVREAALRFVPEGAEEVAPRSRVFRLRSSGALDPVSVVAGISDGAYTEIVPRPSNALKIGDSVVVGLLPQAGNGTQGPGISLGGQR
jgi:HlyD family secretion protein